MKWLRTIILAISVVLTVQVMSLSAEQTGNKEGAQSNKSASKTFAQTIEEIRNSINAGWRKLTNPKTTDPARDSVNEGWKKITDPKTTEPARDEINKAWKGLSDAAGAAVGTDTSARTGKETKSR